MLDLMPQVVMFIWFVITIIFLINFHLAGGYLAMINVLFVAASMFLASYESN